MDRALTCSVEDLPIPEPIEEIMTTSAFESFDSNLEEDIEEMLEEVSDAEEDPSETSELLATEKPSRPPIELKPLPYGLRYAFLNSDELVHLLFWEFVANDHGRLYIAIQKGVSKPCR